MTFLQLFRREMEGSMPRLAFMAALAGVTNAIVLAAVNSGAQAASSGQFGSLAAFLFVVSLLLFIIAQRYVLIVSTAEIEAIIHKLRVRLMDEARRAELVPLESIGRARIVNAITKDTSTLTQAANMLGLLAQGVVLIVFVALYVAYLSLAAFLMSIVIIGLSALVLHATGGKLEEGMRKAGEWENRLFDRLTDLLDGFKEVRLNKARSEGLFNDIVDVSRQASNIKIHAQADEFTRMVFAQSTLYILLAAVVFLVPVFSSTTGVALTETTMALLFIVGTCFGVVRAIPILTAADSAVENIIRLETSIKEAGTATWGPIVPQQRFGTIELRDIAFQYVDPISGAGFRVGPANFTLRSGDLVFLMGGNGSGKSTLVKLLAGLYVPNSGTILLDGNPVGNATRDQYRSLMAAIFTDYHLFHHLYGIPDPDAVEVDRLLTEFLLHDKTRLSDGEFQTLNLSSGQRKRLALIVSLLEKRPILLLDEWAADQDPDFRFKFYHQLLPALNRAGVTLVVVTHDSRYVDELDIPARKVRMEEGRFVADESGETER